jgi:D-glycero-alpha-D-manno-heptose-7-phosphate kinase
MSFVGGGSDLPSYYRKFGGAVLSVAVDKGVYVTVNRKFDHAIRVSYAKTEEVEHVDEIQHPLVRACLQKLNIPGGIEITTVADIPSKGTGLGSSSTFTVGLLHALHAFKERYVSAEQLGRESCEVEIDLCKEPIGKQDQYAAAYGGLNYITFNPDESVCVQPVICKKETIQTIEQNILVFYTGITRSASTLLLEQQQKISSSTDKQKVLHRMVELTRILRDELQSNNTHSFGEILDENWQLKKSISDNISTSTIDQWYERAKRAGATGGKILGAGAGGFLMLYAPKEKHPAIIKELQELREIPMGFDMFGSRIIFFH